ncbi:hypothetical protein [Actinacidiphila yeochonensis]|uniref:hypothetical protein n=1 Tax=Actinacidiphila yeochonensis TaxID=89050 RepID=UPI000B2B6A99|nr:hypothetical protein [Actinacidiphila yeochonensis]
MRAPFPAHTTEGNRHGCAARGRPARPAHSPTPATKQDADAARVSIGHLVRVGGIVTKSLLGLGLGALVFTCVNVTRFATSHDIPAYIAWMLDPLASVALITVLYVDGVLVEHGGTYKPSGWPFMLRWAAGLSTWVMNCWTSLYPDGRFHPVPQHPDAGGILLHSVAPALLILLSEAAAGYRRYVSARRVELTDIIDRFAAAEAEKKDSEVRRARELRDREDAEKRAAAEREATRVAENEAAEREARRERERLAAEIEAERERVALAAQTAEIEAGRERRAAEIEAARRRTDAEIAQAERDRETARQAELIRAEAEAEALREKAAAEARAVEEAERARQQRALERAANRTRAASESTSQSGGRRTSISGGATSESASQSGAALIAVRETPTSESGRVPRDVREQQRDEAERYVAKCLLDSVTPDLDGLAQFYGKGETWTGDRVRAARRRLSEEHGFEAAVRAANVLDGFTNDDAAGAA